MILSLRCCAPLRLFHSDSGSAEMILQFLIFIETGQEFVFILCILFSVYLYILHLILITLLCGGDASKFSNIVGNTVLCYYLFVNQYIIEM